MAAFDRVATQTAALPLMVPAQEPSLRQRSFIMGS
jgi:hypothetical protein